MQSPSSLCCAVERYLECRLRLRTRLEGLPDAWLKRMLKNRAGGKQPIMVAGHAGRIADFVESGRLALGGVKFFVLDEADRLLDTGGQDVINQLWQRFPKAGSGIARLQVSIHPAHALPTLSCIAGSSRQRISRGTSPCAVLDAAEQACMRAALLWVREQPDGAEFTGLLALSMRSSCMFRRCSCSRRPCTRTT